MAPWRDALAAQWPLVAAAVSALVAAADPSPGARIQHDVNPYLVGFIFVVSGLGIDVYEMARGLAAIHVHVPMQAFVLLVTPGLYYFAVYRQRWEVSSGWLTPSYADGCMAVMAMPTPVSTSLIFTQQAHGDVVLASFNMAASNLLGVVTSPVLLGLMLHRANSTETPSPLAALPSTLEKLLLETAVPLLSGVVARVLLQRHWPQRIAPIRRAASLVQALVLIVLFWLLFSGAFAKDAGRLAPAPLARLAVWCLLVHLVLLALTGLLSWPLSPPRRVAALLVAPQKTEGMAIAVLATIGVQAAILPVLLYHSLQMVVAAMLVPCLRRHVDAAAATRTDCLGGDHEGLGAAFLDCHRAAEHGCNVERHRRPASSSTPTR